MRFSGRIQRVRSFEGNGYYVLKVFVDQRNRVETVVGNIPGLNVMEGMWIAFDGEYTTHPKYGAQLKINRAPLMDPESSFEVVESMCSHGVSRVILDRVRKHSVDDADFLAKLADPLLLRQVPDLTEGQADMIHVRWKTLTTLFKSFELLGLLGLQNHQIMKVWNSFKSQELFDVLSKNPWELTKIDDIPFASCDALAKQLGLSMDAPERLDGAIVTTVRRNKDMGSLFIGTAAVVAGAQELLIDKALSTEDVAKSLKRLHAAKKIVVDKTRPGLVAVFDPWSHHIEQDAANRLLERKTTAVLSPERQEGIRKLILEDDPSDDLEMALSKMIRRSGTFSYSDTQIQAAVNALIQPVSILTGGPGSGKTTTLKMVVRACNDLGVKWVLVAPTGIAAKRASQVTGFPASTIHREFGASGMSEKNSEAVTYEGIVGMSTKASSSGEDAAWGRNPTNPHDAHLVIVEETSMVDQHCLYRILQGTRDTTRILFVGDHAQLPSVGAGNVMEDLLLSKAFPVTELKEIFRQEDTSGIVIAAHDINSGDMPRFEEIKEDFTLLENGDAAEIEKIILTLIEHLMKTNMSFQVMSPRHRGDSGVTSLNSKIRAKVNPKDHTKRELRVGEVDIREGDRVMVFQNDYELDVFNGDIGKISDISDDRSKVTVKTYDVPSRFIEMERDTARKLLRLAYAVTVHKSQGQEWDVVIIPWLESFGQQLRRNLLYTAITRAKKKVFLIGQKSAVARAISNGSREIRNTLLKDRLQKQEETP